MMHQFSTQDLPSDPKTWPKYIKVVPTSMIRIDGPFEVETSEGVLTCQDGYLAMDARGYVYPIAVDEQAMIYQPFHEDEA
jgi:hypothetical protein